MKYLFFFLLFLCASLTDLQAARYYVNASTGNDTNTGTSWAQAFKSFQKAIEVAQNDDEIWLTGGTYRPTKNFSGQTYPDAGIYGMGFYITKSLQIYGRFAGTETTVAQRNSAVAPTIFSGDFFGDDLANPAQSGSDIQGENTQRILYMSNLPANGKIRLDDVVVTASVHGGGLLIVDGGSNIVITHCRFTGNFGYYSTEVQIGGASFIGGSATGCYPKLDHCTFDHNNYESSHGACHVWGATGPCKATFTDCNFESNSGLYGGGLAAFGANGACEATLTGCTFTNNSTAISGVGGAISSYNTTLNCTNCLFDNNTAYTGGAISATETAGSKNIQLANCSFNNNSARRAGAIHLQSVNCSILSSTLYQNLSEQTDGGAILIEPSLFPQNTTFYCDDVDFSLNNTMFNGGAICDLDSMVSVQIERSKFYGNKSRNGGALYMDFTGNSTVNTSINESIFQGNEAAGGSGGAIYLKQAPGTSHPGGLKVSFSTLYNNLCNVKGHQVFADHAQFEGINLISWIDAGSSGTGEFAGINTASINATRSLVTSADCSAAGLNNCIENIFGLDPQFVDPAQEDLHLEKCSPAVNTGGYTNQNITDYEGNPRPYNDGNHLLDMGALEYQGVVSGCVKAICKNIAVNLNTAGSITVPAASINDGSTGCATLTYKIDDQASKTFICNQLGDQLVTLKVTDCTNNSAACTATVTVRDITTPTMLCKPATLNLNAAGQATLTIAQVDNGSYDNCSLNKSLSQSTFSCANTGLNTITLSGNDAAGNKGFCSSTVTVKDITAPTVKCKNITANLASNGSVSLAMNAVDNGSSDNCSLTLLLTPYAFNCGNVGANNVTLRATDASGNSSTCAAVVTVKDVTAPNALCKNATVTLNDQGQGTLIINQLNNGSSDACGIATMTLSKTQFNCSDLPGSSQSVTLTLKDVNNNTSSCTAQVTIKDNLAPTAICENTTVHLGANGNVTVYPADLALNSFDNCSVTSYSPVAKVYTAANLGNNNLTITVKDWGNNGATCVSVVTVQPFTGFKGGGNRSDEPSNLLNKDFVFSVFPNPTAGDATVDFELTEDQSVSIRVFDLTGRLVNSQNLEGLQGSNQVRLEMTSMPNGVYVIDIQAGDVRGQKRLMVQSN